MVSKPRDDPSFGVEASRYKTWLMTGFGLIAAFFVTYDLLGAINGGGLFSIISAAHSAAAKAKNIDVDESGLQTLILMALAVPIFATCIYFNLNPKKRIIMIPVVMSLMGGTITLNMTYGDRLIEHYMTTRGYTHYRMADRVVGNGKERIWFDNYVLISSYYPIDAVIAAYELKRKLPIRTGKLTRLEYMTISDRYITYAYTLTKASGVALDQKSAAAIASSSAYLNGGLKADACAHRTRNALSQGLIMNFRYAGENGLVRMVSVSPRDCE